MVISISIISNIYFFVLETFKILSSSYLKIYNKWLLTLVTLQCCRARVSNPQAMDSTNLWPVRNRQEVSGWVNQHYRLSSASCQISGSAAALDSHRSTNPIVNCACEGSRLPAPYENLMPDDLRWNSFILKPLPTKVHGNIVFHETGPWC